MFEDSPLLLTLLGTFFTWGMTTLGALGCVLHNTNIESMKLLDCSLGFSAGVMLAASYWSLLSPASELAEKSGYGQFSFFPLLVGIILGSIFVLLADIFVPFDSFLEESSDKNKFKYENNISSERTQLDAENYTELRQRKPEIDSIVITDSPDDLISKKPVVGRRLLLMMIAVTVHNIPEGLAVGVGFAAPSSLLSSNKASHLALAIGLQNLPEGLAVSLPLRAAGVSTLKSVWYGQLSGLVEPIAGVIGCIAVQWAQPILPYALAFAAGAMIFVVFHDVVPEYQRRDNGNIASIFAMFGFVLMMCLDMGLG